MKSKILTFFFLGVATSSLLAVDINFSSSTTNGIANSFGSEFGNPDAINLYIDVGTYESSTFMPLGGGETSVNFGIFSGSVSGLNTTATGLDIVDNQLAIRIYNASSIAAATEFGIFYMDKSTNTNWAVVSGDAGQGGSPDFNSNSIDLGDLTGSDTGSVLIAGANIVNGSFGSNIGSLGNPNFLTGLSAVPEPSTYALFAGILALGFIVVHRSRV